MCPDKKRPAENTCRIVKGLDVVWAHFCPSKPCLPLLIDGSIAFDNEGSYEVMFNPVIVKKSGAYETAEGCLSLVGRRKTTRFQTIKVQWQNEKFQTRLKTFTGWTAQIIQHEIDHCEGILI